MRAIEQLQITSPIMRHTMPAREGPPDRAIRFDKAAKAIATAISRNAPVKEGGSHCPVIVEGLKDERALRELGFTGTIEKVNKGWSRSRLIAYLHDTYGMRNIVDKGPPVIVAMDWDRTGGQLQRFLRDRLMSLDVTVDEEMRTVLMRVMKPEGRTIESLLPHAPKLVPLISSYIDANRISPEGSAETP